jgi:ABC-type proline/glycine betaine transport system ATPase subunit
MSVSTIERLKRQAEIISKECGKSHAEALELASRLNGFKHFHEAQMTLPQAQTQRQKEFVEEFFADLHKQPVVDPSLQALLKSTKNLTGQNSYRVKLKATAEVCRFITVFGTDLNDVIRKVEGQDDWVDPGQWEGEEVIGIVDSSIRITDVANVLDATDYRACEDGLSAF